MPESSVQQLAQSIYEHFSNQGMSCAAKVDLCWLLERWKPHLNHTRKIENADVKEANRVIDQVPTGKRKHYRLARDNIMQYLGDYCGWQLPEKIDAKLQDREHEWFEAIANEAGNAGQAFRAYEHDKNKFITHRILIPSELAALTIAFYVAPLSIAHLAQILSDRCSIDYTTTMPRLTVYHLKAVDHELSYTHYFLPPFAARLLSDYFDQHSTEICEKKLLTLINDWAAKNRLQAGNQITWQRRFQCMWSTRYQIPPILLKDLAYPERHVGLSHDRTITTHSDIFGIDWDLKWFEKLSPNSTKTRWRHKKLIKSGITSSSTFDKRDWNKENILPMMLYLYTAELLQYGGPKKKNLAPGTIVNYTAIETWLTLNPLSYTDAINEEAINLWAEKLYQSVNNNSARKMIFKFLKFLSFQELTESLDSTLLTSPTNRPSVSAYRLNLNEFNQLISTLVDAPNDNPLRSLFAIIAALLGMFTLRRGEVLRLRNRDVLYDHHSRLLTLFVTNTAEGRTKNGHSRHVYTVIPTRFCEFFDEMISLKKQADADAPFIGMAGEKLHERQLYYLIPVTRALKSILGHQGKFHHLRHSGVHVLMLQALHMVSGTPERDRGNSPLELEMMSDETLKTRFSYWLEGREFHHVNDGILLDEICRQVGHEYYATSRWSYLHDIDWLLPIISPAHQHYIPREYSHQELRYLLGLSPSSNDLSRILKKLSPEYMQKTLEEKRHDKIWLTEDCLRSVMFPTIKKKTPSIEVKADHFRRWQTSAMLNTGNLFGYIYAQMRHDKAVDFSSLSMIWSLGSKHNITTIDKPRVTAFRTLPPIQFSNDNQSLFIHLECNVKNGRAVTKALRHSDLGWFAYRFTLTTNRKLNPRRQEAILESHFQQRNESVTFNKQPVGNTRLTITLSPKRELPKSVLRYTYQFLSELQSQKGAI